MSMLKTCNIYYNSGCKMFPNPCWVVTFTNGISSKPAYFRVFDTETEAKEFAAKPRFFNDGTDTNF